MSEPTAACARPARDAVVELQFHNPPINMYDVRMRDELCELLDAVIVDRRAGGRVHRDR